MESGLIRVDRKVGDDSPRLGLSTIQNLGQVAVPIERTEVAISPKIKEKSPNLHHQIRPTSELVSEDFTTKDYSPGHNAHLTEVSSNFNGGIVGEDKSGEVVGAPAITSKSQQHQEVPQGMPKVGFPSNINDKTPIDSNVQNEPKEGEGLISQGNQEETVGDEHTPTQQITGKQMNYFQNANEKGVSSSNFSPGLRNTLPLSKEGQSSEKNMAPATEKEKITEDTNGGMGKNIPRSITRTNKQMKGLQILTWIKLSSRDINFPQVSPLILVFPILMLIIMKLWKLICKLMQMSIMYLVCCL